MMRTMSVKWTEVVSALSSVMSSSLAIIAAIFAYRGVRTAWRSYEVQQQQLNRSVELQARNQAENFCVWLEWRESAWVIMIHNASPLPVYDVIVSWDLDDPVTWSGIAGTLPDVSDDERTGLLGDWDFNTVGPSPEPQHHEGVGEWIRSGVSGCLDVFEKRDHGLIFPPDYEIAFKNLRLRTVFTDAAGVYWERLGGQLQRWDDRLKTPADRSDTSPASAV